MKEMAEHTRQLIGPEKIDRVVRLATGPSSCYSKLMCL